MRSVLKLMLIVLLVLGAESSALAQSGKRAKHKQAHSCCATVEEESSASFSASSLYQITSSWQSQAKKTVRLQDFAGHPVIITMIFTHCSYACPQIVADVQRIASQLPPEVAADARFVFVSMDVRRDTPDTLAAFASKMNMKDSNWILLHGKADDTREIAALLGIKYKQMPGGDFSHSNIITVLNAQGEITHQQNGLNAEPTLTIQAVQKVYKQTHQSQ